MEKRERNAPLRIAFEGNIGVGKSTLLRLLCSHPRLTSVAEGLEEPLAEWQNVRGTGLNILQSFYEEPQRYAYLFQNFVFITRFLQFDSACKKSNASLLLSERSLITDRCVFVETVSEQSYFNNLELTVYDTWYNAVLESLPNVIPDAFVYLRADPEECFRRLKERARCEEAGVTLDYLVSLHEKHDKWFMKSLDGEDYNRVLPEGTCVTSKIKGCDLVPTINGKPVLVVNYNKLLEKTSLLEEMVDFLLGILYPNLPNKVQAT